MKPLSEINLLLDTKKSCHLALAELIISRRQLNSLDVEDAIIHFLGAEAFNSAGLMLMQALQTLNSMDVLVDERRLERRFLSHWGSLPLPEQMDLDIRLLLRGLQIATRHKYGEDISYLVQDLDKLLAQASENEVVGILSATMLTNLVFSHNDPIRANRFLRTALQLLPYVQNLRIPGSDEPILSDGVSLEFAIWTNSTGITTIDHMRDIKSG